MMILSLELPPCSLPPGSFASEVQEWATGVISGQTASGRILVVFKFFCNIVAMVLFVIDTTRVLMEECIGWEDHITLQIDFALGIVFLLLFLLRVVSAPTMLSAMTTLDTIVDMFTLPPLFLSVWLGRTWLGLRFFRFLMFFNLPNVLMYVHLLTNNTSIRLAQLLSMILGFLFWSAGAIQLLENMGDPWHDHENAREKVGTRGVGLCPGGVPFRGRAVVPGDHGLHRRLRRLLPPHRRRQGVRRVLPGK